MVARVVGSLLREIAERVGCGMVRELRRAEARSLLASAAGRSRRGCVPVRLFPSMAPGVSFLSGLFRTCARPGRAPVACFRLFWGRGFVCCWCQLVVLAAARLLPAASCSLASFL